MVKNLLMIAGVVLIGWWLYGMYRGEPVSLGDWIPEASLPGKPSQVDGLRESLQALYGRVSAPLDEGGAVSREEIEALSKQCQQGFHDGIYPEEPALAGWRLCRVLQRMATERNGYLQQMEQQASAPVRRLPRPHRMTTQDQSAANANAMARRKQAWQQYVDPMRAKCERYLAAME